MSDMQICDVLISSVESSIFSTEICTSAENNLSEIKNPLEKFKN